MLYKRITTTVADRGKLVPVNEVKPYIEVDKDIYVSIYDYTDEHKKQFEETGTIAGINDVTTSKIFFDFDKADDVEQARKDAITLCDRLKQKGIPEDYILTFFSGNKGFNVEVNLSERLSVEEFKNITFQLAGDLQTFDKVVSNASRIIRIPGTKHQKSGLYKIPLRVITLKENDASSIKQAASDRLNGEELDYNKTFKMSPELIALKHDKPKKDRVVKDVITTGLDWSNKPKFLTNCRWSLQNGFFEDGSRSTALLCLAATYKNLGFDLEHTYRLLKGTAELQSKRSGEDRFPDEEIYNNICVQVFSNTWKNGQYSCREEGSWLNEYCLGLGDKKCNHKLEDDLKPKRFIDLRDTFKDYVKNIDKNTIYTGLPSIDRAVFLSTGANVSIVAAAGAGKTSIGLEILNNTSKAGVVSVCASLDMAKNRIFEKIMYRLSGLDRKDLYKMFQDNKEGPILEKLQEEFGNVYFFKKSSPTVQDIKEYILNVQETTGKKVKLLVTDYFERISSEIGDDTAASKKIAGDLQDLVDDLDICNITLYQPNKNALSGGPDQPIYDYTKIKGSSFVYQSARIIMSCWRPFYNPKDFSNDRYMQLAVLKNDLGELSEMAFSWNGKRGLVYEMEDHERYDFEALLAQKEKHQNTEGF